MAHSSYTLLSVQSCSLHHARTRCAPLAEPAYIFCTLPGGVRPFQRRPSPARTAYFRRSPIATAFAFSAAAGVVSNEDWVGISGNYEYNRLLPCRPQNRPPRVEHLVVAEGGPVLDYICNALDLPPLYVADLISFGAVYYALVSPTPPPNASQEQVEIFKRVTAPSVLQKRISIKGKTVREAQKTYRITCPKEFVEADTYLRVYVYPKRFPRCYELDWKSRIIAMTEKYVVLDKPAATSEKKVEKLYLALAVAPVRIGVISHYMRPVNRAPRVVSEDFIERWHLCQLEVLECREIPWPSAEIERENSIEDCGWPLKHLAYECKIKLLTGKTHQIRAQLAAIGSPIVGDSMYMSAFMREKENPKVNPFGKYGGGSVTGADVSRGDAAISEWIGLHGKEPVAAIGLQAYQISWDDDTCLYNAGTPWWR